MRIEQEIERKAPLWATRTPRSLGEIIDTSIHNFRQLCNGFSAPDCARLGAKGDNLLNLLNCKDRQVWEERLTKL